MQTRTDPHHVRTRHVASHLTHTCMHAHACARRLSGHRRMAHTACAGGRARYACVRRGRHGGALVPTRSSLGPTRRVPVGSSQSYCVRACVDACACVCVCVRARVCVRAHARACVDGSGCAGRDDTLVIVTADHETGGLSVGVSQRAVHARARVTSAPRQGGPNATASLNKQCGTVTALVRSNCLACAHGRSGHEVDTPTRIHAHARRWVPQAAAANTARTSAR